MRYDVLIERFGAMVDGIGGGIWVAIVLVSFVASYGYGALAPPRNLAERIAMVICVLTWAGWGLTVYVFQVMAGNRTQAVPYAIVAFGIGALGKVGGLFAGRRFSRGIKR